MTGGIENIGKRDILWSYAATVFTVGAWVILLPFILNQMSGATVGIWNIFQTISALILLLDFGFRPSFARNISYIFSGAKHLQINGVEHIQEDTYYVDYGLMKGLLTAMRHFYRWMALAVFVLLATFGTAYFYYLLGKYEGDHTDAFIAWIILVVINCYNLYTMYYDALLLGKGYIKESQKITILGQALYICVAITLIYCGCGLSAIVGAQFLSILVRRILSYRTFFTSELKEQLQTCEEQGYRPIMKAIFPNAMKVGLTNLGGFCVNKSSILIGSAFLTLEQIASYGITLQVMDLLARCGTVFYNAYTPKLAQCRTHNKMAELRKYYILSVVSLLLIYVVCGNGWIFLGDTALDIINSQTRFVAIGMLAVMLIISLLEQNHIIASGFIMSDNRIPFFIPSLASGAATILLLYVFLGPLGMGIWGLILAPGIAQLAYQNWKWPSVMIKEFNVYKKQNKILEADE